MGLTIADLSHGICLLSRLWFALLSVCPSARIVLHCHLVYAVKHPCMISMSCSPQQLHCLLHSWHCWVQFGVPKLGLFGCILSKCGQLWSPTIYSHHRLTFCQNSNFFIIVTQCKPEVFFQLTSEMYGFTIGHSPFTSSLCIIFLSWRHHNHYWSWHNVASICALYFGGLFWSIFTTCHFSFLVSLHAGPDKG